MSHEWKLFGWTATGYGLEKCYDCGAVRVNKNIERDNGLPGHLVRQTVEEAIAKAEAQP